LISNQNNLQFIKCFKNRKHFPFPPSLLGCFLRPAHSPFLFPFLFSRPAAFPARPHTTHLMASANPCHHCLQPGVFTSEGSFPPYRVHQGFLSTTKSQFKPLFEIGSTSRSCCVRQGPKTPIYRSPRSSDFK
jgi:hypothetical protein